MKTSHKILSLMFAGALWHETAMASAVYTVTVNTSSIAGQDGYLDLQFEQGPTPANLATATVTGFSTDGTLTGAGDISGDVTGQLPAMLSFDNQTVFNDYFQETTFGLMEVFVITLNGPTPLGGGPSAFNISFYAADQSTPILTTSSDGEAGQIVLNADGTTSVQTFPATLNGASVLTITPTVSGVPEPATVGFMGLGLASILLYSRIRRN
jgi:PEP-CTERM motif